MLTSGGLGTSAILGLGIVSRVPGELAAILASLSVCEKKICIFLELREESDKRILP